MAGALGYHASDPTRGPRLCFHVHNGSYDTVSLIEVLTQLGAFYAGEQVVLLWDGLGAHRSHAMLDWLATQRDWLQVERLPAYAPELNSVEYLTLLYMSSGLGRVLRGHVVQHGEDLAGHVALQAPDDLGLGLALLGAPGQVVPGGLVPA
jgi:hypothetical protein